MSFLTQTRCLLLLAAGLGCAAQASADVLVSEPFTYANGNLTGDGTYGVNGFTSAWQGFGTNGAGTWTVSGDAAVVAGWGSTYITRNFGSPVVSIPSSFYFSYDLSVNTLNLTSTTNFVDALIINVGGTSFYTGIHYQSWGYNLALSSPTASSSSQTSYNLTTASTTANVPYTIVGQYSFDSGTNTATLSLWVNPTNSTDPATYSVSWTATSAAASKFTLQRFDAGTDSTKTGTNSTTFDNILVGTTWDDVATSAIPEPATYAALVGALALGAALWRRRRG